MYWALREEKVGVCSALVACGVVWDEWDEWVWEEDRPPDDPFVPPADNDGPTPKGKTTVFP